MSDQMMTDQAARTEFHPRWYREPVSTWWWLGEWHYLKFILRELSSLFFVGFKSPDMITFNMLWFCFVMFHAITWFNLAPRAMPVRIGGKRVPEFLVAAPNYVLWIIVSAFVGWLLLRTP